MRKGQDKAILLHLTQSQKGGVRKGLVVSVKFQPHYPQIRKSVPFKWGSGWASGRSGWFRKTRPNRGSTPDHLARSK